MNLLEILFPSIDNEQSDAIYGQHLFGKFRHDIFKEDIPPEENTAAENKLWNALGSYYSWNEKQGLNDLVPEMLKVSSQELYPEFFKVNNQKAWRLLIGLSEDSIKHITGLDKPGKMGMSMGGVLLNKQGSNFSSWTIDVSSLQRLFNQAKSESGAGSVLGYIVLAEVDTGNNNFFFNMFAAAKYLVVGGSFEYQQEVLGAGPMNLNKISYIKLDKDPAKSPIPVLVDLLNDKPNTYDSYQEYIKTKSV
jgi:hypothetical protein